MGDCVIAERGFDGNIRAECAYKALEETIISRTKPITLTIAVPCYNSALYMDTCIESLLKCGSDIEIIIVDDGSNKDDTPQKADEWAELYPDRIRAIHKENGGHGSAVNAGMANARGRYFKVVDSDDWLDETAMRTVMTYLRAQALRTTPTDLVIANYVYDKVYNNKHSAMRNRAEYPVGVEFGWEQLKAIIPGKYLHMHSTIFRTDLLREVGLQLPEHCFYVDNLYVYQMLPHVKTMFYIDENMYHYFIGREDQSVNEDVMYQRIDQHITVTRMMISQTTSPDPITQPHLFKSMRNHLGMMMVVCSIYLRMNDNEEDAKKLADMWDFLHENNEDMFKSVKHHFLVLCTNIPGRAGRIGALWGYRLAQKIFGFN